MLVNNEVGTVQPLDEVAALVRDRAPQAVLHTDAVQAVPWLDVAERLRRADLVADLGAQVRRAQGCGRARAREATAGRAADRAAARSGACARARRTWPASSAWPPRCASRPSVAHAEVARVRRAARPAGRRPAEAVPDCFINGDAARKVAGNCHVGFPGVEAEALLRPARPRQGSTRRRVRRARRARPSRRTCSRRWASPRDDALASIRLQPRLRVHGRRRRRGARRDPARRRAASPGGRHDAMSATGCWSR